MQNLICKQLSGCLIFFGLMICIAGCEGGCNKKSVSPKSTWQIGTNNYSSSSSVVAGNSISASNETNSYYIYFANLPTVNGTYQIVAYNTTSTLTANQVVIKVNTSPTNVYLSTGSGNVTARVTVSGSKINVTVPTFWAQHYNSFGEQADSLQASGTLLQY